jgi:tetratricopeptide (TPR) repeat protein
VTGGGGTLSKFTPSLMPHELLERLFVARDRTLEAILARVDAAAGSAERNHTLLVGPRGAGKTHLVSLVYHRINERRRAGASLQVAWLPEDPWTIVSYRHLLSALAERLEPTPDQELPRSAPQLESLLSASAAAGGPIVVLVENLDRILDALGDEGQQRLRHFLQAERSLLLIATSTRLDRTLSDQASPFYAFFTTTRLEPFDVDEAAAMLTAIAEERDDQDLVDYLHGVEGRARLRTIVHLAGGQPRMWAALASALTVSGLAELIDLLLTRFDDLTPYYQEQLARLSGQQRLVVAELAQADRPINVRDLAERLELEQRSLGKTISELVDRGWASPTSSPVTALVDRRRTYYELAEPLARLSFQIKDSRGEPLRLVVEFLKHWFDPTDLGAIEADGVVAEYVLLASEGHERDPVIAVTRSLQRLPVTRAPAVALLGESDDALAALASGDPEPFIRLPTPVRSALEEQLGGHDLVDVRRELHRTALAEFGHNRHPAMAAWIERAEDIAAAHGPGVTAAQLLLADWLGRAWRFDEAAEVVAAAAATLGEDHPDTLTSRNNLAYAYQSAGRLADVIPLYERTLADRVRVLGEDHPQTLASRNNLAVAYKSAGRLGEAIPLYERTLADSERVLGEDHPQTLASRNNFAVAYKSAGRLGEAIPLFERTLADSERVLGEDHPDTLTSRNNLAVAYKSAGRLNDPDTATLRENLAQTPAKAKRP